MKRILFIAFLYIATISLLNAQTASATWTLIADTAAVTLGNVTAPAQFLTTADTNVILSVRDYLGGTTTSGSQVGLAERIWRDNYYWMYEPKQNDKRYIQYSISPLQGNNLTVGRVALNIGGFGWTTGLCANVFWSKDSNFNVRTMLNADTLKLPDIRTNVMLTLSYSLSVSVAEGETFYVRVYPYSTYAKGSSQTKYICINNVVISGVTASNNSAIITSFPDSIDFGKTNVNSYRRINSITISGSSLNPISDSIRLTATEGFYISTSSESEFSSYLAVPYTNGMLSNTTIYVKFLPTFVTNYNGTISVNGGGASTQIVKLIGECVEYPLGIFVATSGSDSSNGDFNTPFRTLKKAISSMQAGDTVFVRGGNYVMDTVTLNITAIGNNESRYCIFGYSSDNQRPLLDFSAMSFGKRGILLSGNYWHIKGIDVYRAGDNGMRISGSNNIIEYCSFFENQGSGLQLTGTASNNKIINCDSYFNYDEPTLGENADGFAPKQMTGVNNYFYGCRAWQNADDGWDCFEAVATVTLDNCWAFSNGYLKDGVTTTSAMDGNGFKMGGNYTENDITLQNCLAFKNKGKGFDQNNNRGSMTLYNCTGYNNGGNNYAISSALNTGKTLTLANCIELGNKRSIGSFAIQTTNSWLSPFTGASTSDFISLDTTGVTGTRKPDGSLPDISYMHLVSNSQFVNSGTDVGLPFKGTHPDLGCFETDVVSFINEQDSKIAEYRLFQNYPNPFNPTTIISYQLSALSNVTIKIFDVLGREVAMLVNQKQEAGVYSVKWTAQNMPSGVYFCVLENNNEKQMKKLMLVK